MGGEPRRVLVIGGANPDGSFADVYSLDLGLLLNYRRLLVFFLKVFFPIFN